MGHAQSDSAADAKFARADAVEQNQPTSMEALIAEATAFGESDDESLDVRAQRALECPCVAGLRSGPCGAQFSEAFICFLKSTAEEKGSDCVHPFVALQNCIKVNPDAFSDDVLGEDNNEEVNEVQDYKFIPPEWAKEEPNNKPPRL